MLAAFICKTLVRIVAAWQHSAAPSGWNQIWAMLFSFLSEVAPLTAFSCYLVSVVLSQYNNWLRFKYLSTWAITVVALKTFSWNIWSISNTWVIDAEILFTTNVHHLPHCKNCLLLATGFVTLDVLMKRWRMVTLIGLQIAQQLFSTRCARSQAHRRTKESLASIPRSTPEFDQRAWAPTPLYHLIPGPRWEWSPVQGGPRGTCTSPASRATRTPSRVASG